MFVINGRTSAQPTLHHRDTWGFEQNFLDLSALDEITGTAIIDIEARLGVTGDPPAS
jgi:hypothetical protein